MLVQLWNFAGNLFSRRCKIRAQSRNSPISIGFSSIFFFSQALPLIRKWFPLWSKEANRGSWIINDDLPEEIFISSPRSKINFNTNRFHLELSEARFLLQHAQIELKLIKINFSRLNQLFYSIGSHFADPAAPQSSPERRQWNNFLMDLLIFCFTSHTYWLFPLALLPTRAEWNSREDHFNAEQKNCEEWNKFTVRVHFKQHFKKARATR